jgi:hypothetical protein
MSRSSSETIRNSRRERKTDLQHFDKLFCLLLEAADWHQPTLSAVLGITPQAISDRMRAKARRAWCEPRRETFRRKSKKEKALRWWWRNRMASIGVDPLMLTPDDPAWHACHKRPRGWSMRQAADEMHAEGRDLRLPDEQVVLLGRIEALVAEHLRCLHVQPLTTNDD